MKNVPPVDAELTLALHNFRRDYPNVTIADLQTFILGWNACLKK